MGAAGRLLTRRSSTSGSHVDTVPDGGRYDGALGTVLGLELAPSAETARARRPAGLCGRGGAPLRRRHRSARGCSPARCAVSALADAASTRPARQRRRRARRVPRGARRAAARASRATERVRAHAEIHVAQRRALRALGVVTRVASPAPAARSTITGQPGHSGEVVDGGAPRRARRPRPS